MATWIVMPHLGTTMTEGVLERWLVKPGDAVKVGDKLAEISTDKYAADIECDVAGVVRAIHVEEGALVPCLTRLALVTSPDEAWSSEAQRIGETIGAESEPDAARRPASPLARRTARELGVSLSDVPVPPGQARVRQADVLSFHDAHRPPAPSGANPRTPMRRAIGEKMLKSLSTAPQVTLMRAANADALLNAKRSLNALKGEAHVTLTDLLIAVVARALRAVPAMNASVVGDEWTLHERVNVGVAVAIEGGLVVPVVRDADRLGLRALSSETRRLIEAARQNALNASDASDGTFTISNLGQWGVEAFTPILNLPECGILGVGAACAQPVVNDDGQLAVASLMQLSLTFDHRAVDGADAAQFLKRVVEYIEAPIALMMEG